MNEHVATSFQNARELIRLPFEHHQQTLRQLSPHVRRTPTYRYSIENGLTAASFYAKLESLQHTGSFKTRGAVKFVMDLSDEERRRGLVVPTVGNGGLGLCYACSLFDLPVDVILTLTASEAIQHSLIAVWPQVNILRYGENWDASMERARAAVSSGRRILYHPFDHPSVILGAATAVVELLEDVPDVEAILVGSGGGSGLAGACLAAKSFNQRIQVIGLEPSGCPAMKVSLERGERVELERTHTVAHGLNVKRVGAWTYEIVSQLCDGIVLVDDEWLFDAMRYLYDQARIVTEPSGAIGVGALRSGGYQIDGKKVAVILTGGNVNEEMFARTLLRSSVDSPSDAADG